MTRPADDVSELIKVLAAQKSKLGRELSDSRARNAELAELQRDARRLLTGMVAVFRDVDMKHYMAKEIVAEAERYLEGK